MPPDLRQPMLDLEQSLRETGPNGTELAGRLARVKASAFRIWEIPRLQWFTDHSADRHSQRIAQMCGGLIEKLQQGPEALNPHELYVLLAAVYLHDIGMQDFRIDGRGPESFSAEDYDLIRKRHPERGKEMIVDKGLSPGRDDFKIDIDGDLDYLIPIALVSQAHGSAYFESTVEELRDGHYSPGNKPLRGALLAALLLFADELDLHEDRAKFEPEMDRSALSTLHHHLNHYVTRVRVGDGETSRERRVHLSLSFPEDSQEYRGAVCLYIASKLSSQAGRVNPVLRGETDGLLEIDRVIRVRSRSEAVAGARRDLPPEALRQLQLELAERQLVGRDQVTGSIGAAVASRATAVMELSAAEEADLPALLHWLQALVARDGITGLHLDLGLEVATEPKDILGELSAAVGGKPAGHLAEIAARAEPYCVLVFEGVDKLLPTAADWLRSELEALLKANASALVVLTRAATSEPAFSGAEIHHLEELPVEVVKEHLRRVFGDDEEEAAERAQDMQILAEGAPARTLMVLEARMNRTWREEDG